MRINCHSHIFNFASVFTDESIDILLDRLTKGGCPSYIAKPLNKLIRELLGGSDLIDREKLSRKMAEKLIDDDQFKDLLGGIDKTDWPIDLRIAIEGDTQTLAAGLLDGLLDKISKILHKHTDDFKESELEDYFEFALIGLLPSIDDVADLLMRQIDEEDAIIALMMDITQGDDNDQKRFRKQIDDTSRQVLRYPGRIFPFVAVNTNRDQHIDILKEAVEQKGYVGVKIYPSLGYSYSDSQMEEVFRICEEFDLPITMHCMEDGFHKEDNASLCEPHVDKWRNIFDQFPKLKLCFGHFGGEENLILSDIPSDSWTGRIVTLMQEFPGQVYADISAHTLPMHGTQEQNNYRSNIKGLLQNPDVSRGLLWGTDFFMIRKRLRESSYWNYFQELIFESSEFEQIAVNNPLEFLSMDIDVGLGENIRRYLKFISSNHVKLGPNPAPWLLTALGKHHPEVADKVTQLGSRWTMNNRIHEILYKYLRYKKQLGNIEFDPAGALPLNQLAYWRTDSADPSIRDNLVLDLAEDVEGRFRLMENAQPALGFNPIKTIQLFCKVLKVGGKTVADFGEAVDKAFNLPQQ